MGRMGNRPREMAVPMSPEELRFKRNSILKHQSQMESAPFLGDDERLFWQRAEDRNRATAELYRKLGLACYEAIEILCAISLSTKLENNFYLCPSREQPAG